MFRLYPSTIFITIIVTLGFLSGPSGADDTLQGVYKASKMVGMPVKNLQGKSIGVIEEIVIETTGTVGYAVLSFGGFLGMGDKLFAVPWTSLAHSIDKNYLTLDIQPEKLERAPGFNKNDWPDMKDKNWQKNISNFYQNSRP